MLNKKYISGLVDDQIIFCAWKAIFYKSKKKMQNPILS